MIKLMHKPGEDPIMTPAQLEALESDLRERAKPLGDRHWIDGTQRLASDLADVVAHLRAMEQDAEQGFHDEQEAANAEPLGVPVVEAEKITRASRVSGSWHFPPLDGGKDAEYYAFCAQTCKCGHPRDVHSMVCSRCECGGFVPLDNPRSTEADGGEVVRVDLESVMVTRAVAGGDGAYLYVSGHLVTGFGSKAEADGVAGSLRRALAPLLTTARADARREGTEAALRELTRIYGNHPKAASMSACIREALAAKGGG